MEFSVCLKARSKVASLFLKHDKPYFRHENERPKCHRHGNGIYRSNLATAPTNPRVVGGWSGPFGLSGSGSG